MSHFTAIYFMNEENCPNDAFIGCLGIEHSPEAFKPLIAKIIREFGFTMVVDEDIKPEVGNHKNPLPFRACFTFEIYGSRGGNPVKRWFGIGPEVD